MTVKLLKQERRYERTLHLHVYLLYIQAAVLVFSFLKQGLCERLYNLCKPPPPPPPPTLPPKQMAFCPSGTSRGVERITQSHPSPIFVQTK